MKIYYGIHHIANEYGLTDEAVRKWRERYDNFPSPDVMIGTTPGWSRDSLIKIRIWRSTKMVGKGYRKDKK